MTSDSYLLVIAVLEGRNFDTGQVSPSPSHSPSTQVHNPVLLLEGRFADEVLVSDPVPFKGQSPKTMTELAWEINRKSLHQFRIERRPIKLQVFHVDSTATKHLVGYSVFDIRSAQETTCPVYQWKPLLNSKYRGISSERPEVLCAVRVIKTDDDPLLNQMKEREQEQDKLSNGYSSDIENHLHVREVDGKFKIWDSGSSDETDCLHQYIVSVVIAAANDLEYLIPLESQSNSLDNEYYFQYSFLGTTIKTASFLDIQACEFAVEKVTFKMSVPSTSVLKTYFDINPNLDILLKRRNTSVIDDRDDQVLGTTTVFLQNLLQKESFESIVGDFFLTSVDESLTDLAGQPRVGLYIDLEEISEPKTTEDSNLNLNQIYLESVKEMEKELKESLNRVRQQEKELSLREKELEKLDGMYKQRFEKLNEEIAMAVQDLKQDYEDKLDEEKKSYQQLEAENRQLIQEISSLKLAAVSTSTSNHIQNRNLNPQSRLRTQSLIRNNSVPNSVRASSSSLKTKTPSVVKNEGVGSRASSSVRPPRDLRARTPSVSSKGPSLPRPNGSSTCITRKPSLTRINGPTSVDKKAAVLKELKNERDSLLKNGLCRSDDPIIKSIEQELRRNGVPSK